MANSVDPDQTAPSDLIWIYTVWICQFVRYLVYEILEIYCIQDLSYYNFYLVFCNQSGCSNDRFFFFFFCELKKPLYILYYMYIHDSTIYI